MGIVTLVHGIVPVLICNTQHPGIQPEGSVFTIQMRTIWMVLCLVWYICERIKGLLCTQRDAWLVLVQKETLVNLLIIFENELTRVLCNQMFSVP